MSSSQKFTANSDELPFPLLIGNPLANATAAVPVEVLVVDNWLTWRIDESCQAEPFYGFEEGDSVEGAVWDFLELRDAPNESFGEFARRYGVLALRSDCLPAVSPEREDYTDKLPPTLDENDDGKLWFIERIAYWRMYSIGLRTALAFATEVRENAYVSPNEVLEKYDLKRHTWESLGLEPPGEGKLRYANAAFWEWDTWLSPYTFAGIMERAGPDLARWWIAAKISMTWIQHAGLTPVLTWEEGSPRMSLGLGKGYFSSHLPDNMLFSVLAAQMAAIVTSERLDRVAQCSVCGRLFLPMIKPGRHERSFCPEHKIEGERERKRRWARKAAAERKAKQAR